MEFKTVRTDNLVGDLNKCLQRHPLKRILYESEGRSISWINKGDALAIRHYGEGFAIGYEKEDVVVVTYAESPTDLKYGSMYTYSACYPGIPGNTTVLHYNGGNRRIEFEFGDRIEFKPETWELDE